MVNQKIDIKNFLDNDKVKLWPSKNVAKEMVRSYIAGYIQTGRKYTEKEINVLIDQYHTFGDPALIRRELCDHGLLKRDNYGREYWKA